MPMSMLTVLDRGAVDPKTRIAGQENETNLGNMTQLILINT